MQIDTLTMAIHLFHFYTRQDASAASSECPHSIIKVNDFCQHLQSV